MKIFTLLHKSTDKGTINIGRKSRIIPMKPLFSHYCMFTVVIMLLLGAFSTRAWAANVAQTTTTIANKGTSATGNGITFSLTGTHRTEPILNRYAYLKANEEFTLSWSGVPTGYTINVTQLKIRTYRENKKKTIGKYKTHKNTTYAVFTETETDENDRYLNSSSYFPLGNEGYITVRAEGDVLQYRDMTFTYTIGNNYSIRFNGNGSTSGSMSNLSMAYYVAKNLTANAFTRSYSVKYDEDGGSSVDDAVVNYTFAGWATSEDGNVVYSDGASVNNLTTTVNGVYDLFAKWNSASVTLPAAPTKSGYQFAGWYIGETRIGGAGGSFTPTSDTTITAHWVEKYDFTVTGDDYTINNEDWNVVDLFTFTYADKANMTVNIGDDKVIGYDVESNTITAKKIGTSTISFTQNTSSTVKNGDSDEWTITVDSVANTLAISKTSFTKFVEQDITSIRSGQNSDGTITTTSSNPNLAYYDIEDNTIYIPNTDAQTLPFSDVIITISQAATAKYKYKKHTITLTVQKYPNALKCAWNNGVAGDDWDENMNFDSKLPVKFSSTNTSGPAISVTQSPASAVATYKVGAGGANPDTIITNYREGSVTWTISQAEDYKYIGDEVTCSVNVGTVYSNCYLVDDAPQREWSSQGNSGTYAFTLDQPGDTLFFDAERIDICVLGICEGNNTDWHIQYSTKMSPGDDDWTKLKDDKGNDVAIECEYKDTYYNGFKYAIPADARAIRFRTANVGSFGKKHIRNVKVGRKKWLTLENEGGSGISEIDMPINTIGGNVTRNTFYIDYSTCASKIKLVSNNSRIKFAASNSTTYEFDVENGTRKAIELTYTSPADAEDIAATITVYTPYEHKTLTVNAETKGKLSTTIEYKGADSYAVDHANMSATDLFQVRDENGDLVASPTITLSSSNTSAINTVSSNTAIDFLCGADDVRITASYAGDATYAAASNVYHDIDVVKLSDAIEWSNVAEDGKIHVWAESDIPSSIASANEAIDAYTSSNSANVRVSGSKGSFALRARRPGEITLTAHSEGSCTYSTAEDTKTIMVDSCAQDIIWEQNLAGISTEEDGTISRRITLNAYAVDSNNVETGRVITYSLPANTSFASIENGNELVLTDTGSVVLTASTASDDTIYAQAQASKLVRVRVYGTGCGSEVVDKDQHAVGAYDNNKGKQYGDVTPLPPIDKIYVRVGKYSDVATQTLYIYGYNASGTETTLASYGVGSLSTSGADKELSNISEDICRIKIKAGGTISKWYSDLRITQKSYLRKSVENVSNDHLFVYENVNETIRVSYSDKPLLQYRYTGSNLTLTPTETVNNDCGDYGYYDFVLSGSYSRMGDYHDTIYITTTALDTLRVPVYHRVSTGGLLLFNEADGNWNESGKWSNDMLPRRENDVTISKNVIVTGEVEAYSVTIVEGGSVTINPGAGLTVGAGGIVGSTTSNLILKAGTEGATKGQTGYLRISPEYASTMPNATVELYSTAYHNKNAESGSKSRYQCVGAPISDAGVRANTVYPAGTWLYTWNESTETWTNSRSSYTFVPFQGFETTQKKDVDGLGFNYEGHLVSGHDVVTIDLAYTSSEKGYNLLANSWAAPISIEEFKTGDFIDAERTVYILNAGTKNESDAPAGGIDAPGKWIGVPLNTASALAAAGYPCVIPSMQGFWVKANGASAQLKLDYSRLVWGVDYSETRVNKPLRAPKRNAELDEEMDEEMPITGQMMINVSSEQESDVVFMLESERFETAYENGNDAYKIASESLDIYTVEDGDKLSVDATSSMDGTQLGIHTNEETAFTLSFSHVSEEKWALFDMYTNEKIDIYDGTTYTFFEEPNAEINGRFMIVEREAPSITTGVDNADTKVKVHKFIKDNQVLILKNGVLYNTMGAIVR